MTPEDARSLISMLVEWVCVPFLKNDDDDEPYTMDEITAFALTYLDGDAIETCCSEGCQGITPTPGEPGFVLDMASGKRFHVTVKELPR